MSEQLKVSASLINEKVKFKGAARTNPEIMIDYPSPIGDGEGYTSLELFLVSLATCSGTSIAVLLRKMRRDVSGLKIDVKGDRRGEHPTYFEKIFLEFTLKSRDAEASELEKAIKLSEESICPIWNMIKNNVEISYKYTIERG